MISNAREFEVTPLRNSNVQYVYSRKSLIDTDPVYQRQSDAWTLEKKQLLIDSILNGFDIPTIYFHQIRKGGQWGWALVDGKQRLNAIFDFLDGKFALDSEFRLLGDESVKAGGMTRNDLDERYPLLASDLLSSGLDIKEIRTSDIELIEDLFSRLNEAVPLNAAEKRNAFGGPLPAIVRGLVQEEFFVEKLPFGNKRYRHYDLAAKFLLLASHDPHEGWPHWPARDLKKIRLDRLFKEVKDQGDAAMVSEWSKRVVNTVRSMSEIFTTKDQLLTVGMSTVYFLFFMNRIYAKKDLPTRSDLVRLNEARRIGSVENEEEFTRSDIVLLEFNRLSQSPNDGGALAFRFNVLEAWVDAVLSQKDPLDAIARLYSEGIS